MQEEAVIIVDVDGKLVEAVTIIDEQGDDAKASIAALHRVGMKNPFFRCETGGCRSEHLAATSMPLNLL